MIHHKLALANIHVDYTHASEILSPLRKVFYDLDEIFRDRISYALFEEDLISGENTLSRLSVERRVMYFAQRISDSYQLPVNVTIHWDNVEKAIRARPVFA